MRPLVPSNATASRAEGVAALLLALILSGAVLSSGCTPGADDGGRRPAPRPAGRDPLTGSRPVQAPADASAPARLHVTPAALDFGDRGHGETVTLGLTLENRGSVPLTVRAMKPSCDCTRLEPPRLGEPIPPGASVEVDVSMSSGRALGRLSKHVEILTDRSPTAVRVPVVMNVFPGVRTDPLQLRFEGEVGGRPVTQTLDVTLAGRGGGPRLVIDGVYRRGNGSPEPHFEARTESVGDATRIHLTLLPTHPEGRILATLVASLDSKPFHIPVSGEMFRHIKVSPRYFNFNRVDPQTPDTLVEESDLVAIDGRPFRILAAEPVIQRRPPGIEMFVDVGWEPLEERAGYRLRAAIDVPGLTEVARSASFSGKVSVTTDHPGKPEVTLHFMGFFPRTDR